MRCSRLVWWVCCRRRVQAQGAEGHAITSIKVLLRLFERNSENIGAAWRAEMGTALVWLGQHGSYDRRVARCANKLRRRTSAVPLGELAASGALEMAVNASIGGTGVDQLPSPRRQGGALEERQQLRVLSMQGLVKVAARGAPRLMEGCSSTGVPHNGGCVRRELG